jgi:sugar lactone lactonase YvrE
MLGGTVSIDGRVLEFAPPFTNGEKASIVLGQVNFTTVACYGSQSLMCVPEGLAFDSAGDLWVADSQNNRVLEFASPFTNIEKASVVIGEPDFLSSSFNPASRSTVYNPFSITFDSSGNLWVVDSDNNRVLKFTGPFSIGKNASGVLGQRIYNSSSSGFFTNQSNLNRPLVVAFDPSGNLWLADGANNRVLEFVPALSNGKNASLVLGQTDFQSNGFNTTASSLHHPNGLGVDASGNVWIADTLNNRVLEFLRSSSSTTSSSLSSTAPGGGSTSSTSTIVSSSAPQTTSSTTTPASSSVVTQTPTSGRISPLILAGVAVVVVIALAGILVLRGHKPTP